MSNVVNNVEIFTYIDEDGNEVQKFIPVEDIEKNTKPEKPSIIQRIIRWFTNSDIVPYVDIKNISNNGITDDNQGSNKSVEIGIKGKF